MRVNRAVKALRGALLAGSLAVSGVFITASASAETIPYPVGGDASIHVLSQPQYYSASCVNATYELAITANQFSYSRWTAVSTYDGPTTDPYRSRSLAGYGYGYDVFTFCKSSSAPGTYLAKTTIKFYDSADTLLATVNASTLFELRAAASTTSTSTSAPADSALSASRVAGQNGYWKVRGHLTRVSSPMSGQRIVLQRRGADLSWHNTTKTALTDGYGTAVIKVRQNTHVNDRVPYRLRYAGNASTKPAVSTRFRLPKR